MLQTTTEFIYGYKLVEKGHVRTAIATNDVIELPTQRRFLLPWPATFDHMQSSCLVTATVNCSLIPLHVKSMTRSFSYELLKFCRFWVKSIFYA